VPKAERGYIIPAINTHSVDYVSCAQRLRDSILYWHPDANITIITQQDLPQGDQGGQANDWQMWLASPYRQTIKLEADMLASGPIDHWWTLFENRDVVISQGCRNHRDEISRCRTYRAIFDNNDLPDVYNAITYWRLSNTAKEFWDLVRVIFQQWSSFRSLLKFPDDEATTDVVYAMAAKIMGPERVTLPPGLGPTIIHMKPDILALPSGDWRQHLLWEYHHGSLRLNTVNQWGLVHYNQKTWQP
jgi:hypothetical protein